MTRTTKTAPAVAFMATTTTAAKTESIPSEPAMPTKATMKQTDSADSAGPLVMPEILRNCPDFDVRGLTVNMLAPDLLSVGPGGELGIAPVAKDSITRLFKLAKARLNNEGVPIVSFRFAVGRVEDVVVKVAAAAGVTFTAAWRRVAAACGEFARALAIYSGTTTFFLLSLDATSNIALTRMALASIPDLVSDGSCFVNIVVSRQNKVADEGVLELVAAAILDSGLRAAQIAVSARAEATPFFPADDPQASFVAMLALSHVEPLRAAVAASLSRAPADREAAYRALADAQMQTMSYFGRLIAPIVDAAGLVFGGIDLIPGPVHDPRNPGARSLIGLAELAAGRAFTSADVEHVLTPFISALRSGARASGFLRRGYAAGTFQAVAEDGILAERVRNHDIDISDLYRGCAVSAAGVDMVIVDPSTTRKQLTRALVTTALLADRHQKPLAARLICPPAATRRLPNGDVALGHYLLGQAPVVRLPGPVSDDAPLPSLHN